MTNRVFLFGAGSSRDFGLPLGAELFECIYSQAHLLDTDAVNELRVLLGEVDKFLRDIFTNLPSDRLLYPPFEEVLTFLWDCRRSELFDYKQNKLVSIFRHSDGARGVFEIFRKALAVALAGAMLTAQSDVRTALFADFVSHLLSSQDGKVSFISLNYDVLLDRALALCIKRHVIGDYTYGIPLSDVAERYRHATSQRLRHKEGVLLLKPHGSLNLVYCPHKQARYGDGFYCSATDAIAARADALRCPGCGSALKPLLIPPLYNKGTYIDDTAYKSPRITWRSTPETYRKYCDTRISEVLGDADEITVVGYSMPPYEYDFKGLLMKSLMSNPKRSDLRLSIVTKGTRDDVDHLKAQFAPLVGTVDVAQTEGFYKYLTSLAKTKG